METKLWGYLRLIERYQDPIMKRDYRGNEYDSGLLGPLMMRLQCQCGLEFSIRAEDFPGRRKMRACGGSTCPFTKQLADAANGRNKPRYQAIGRPRLSSEPMCIANLYLSRSMIEKIDSLAMHMRISRSETVRQLLDAQLQSLAREE